MEDKANFNFYILLYFMKFINRQKELKFLEGKWLEPGAQLIVLWGKRRVGKTELIYTMGEFFKEPLLQTRGFIDWEEAFRYLSAKKEKVVVVKGSYQRL